MTRLNKRQRAARRMIANMNDLMVRLTGGELRTSQRGVPHVVVGEAWSPRSASVCWFQSTRTFRVFAPHPRPGALQLKRTFGRAEDAARCARRIVALGWDEYALRVACGATEEGVTA